MKTAFQFLWRNIKWVIYYRATIWDRMAYDEGVRRGMNCRHVRVVGPQMTQEVKFYPGTKPQRNFLTYREFIN